MGAKRIDNVLNKTEEKKILKLVPDSEVPTFSEFNPTIIPSQYDVLYDIENYNYELGTHQVLLSGAVGSAKSLLLAHLAVKHCLKYPGAKVGIGRLALPDVKETLLQMIFDHMGDEIIYRYNENKKKIFFPNGSSIRCFSWHDKKYKKFRSYSFSLFIIEELTENDSPAALKAILERIGRMRTPHRLLVCATNPDEPDHWAYDWFIKREDNPLVHVYYSLTEDNPFLHPSYIEMFKENYTERECLRLLKGRWITIAGEGIYYAYDSERHFRKAIYKPDSNLPIHVSFDFNIGVGKPMSCCLFQCVAGVYHFFASVVVHSADTNIICVELLERGLLNYNTLYIINGDCNGRNRDTRSKTTDYNIIKEFLDYHKCRYKMAVPRQNPAIRTRHNIVNGKMRNAKGQSRIYLYEGAEDLDEGFKLTKLKKKGYYVEDDTFWAQHVATAAGYGICTTEKKINRKPQGTIQL
jgi:hypothetical protein